MEPDFVGERITAMSLNEPSYALPRGGGPPNRRGMSPAGVTDSRAGDIAPLSMVALPLNRQNSWFACARFSLNPPGGRRLRFTGRKWIRIERPIPS